jgi:hypothetical protein
VVFLVPVVTVAGGVDTFVIAYSALVDLGDSVADNNQYGTPPLHSPLFTKASDANVLAAREEAFVK